MIVDPADIVQDVGQHFGLLSGRLKGIDADGYAHRPVGLRDAQ